MRYRGPASSPGLVAFVTLAAVALLALDHAQEPQQAIQHGEGVGRAPWDPQIYWQDIADAAQRPKKSVMSSRVSACVIPATGVRPLFFTFVAVRAMAPVAGIPPNSGEAMFAMPWATSSMLERWRPPIMPCATTAENSDSIAASNAMVKAGIEGADVSDPFGERTAPARPSSRGRAGRGFDSRK